MIEGELVDQQQLVEHMQQLQSQQVITTEPAAAPPPATAAATPTAASSQMEEQTIYLDAEGRGTATAIVDGKEVPQATCILICILIMKNKSIVPRKMLRSWRGCAHPSFGMTLTF